MVSFHRPHDAVDVMSNATRFLIWRLAKTYEGPDLDAFIAQRLGVSKRLVEQVLAKSDMKRQGPKAEARKSGSDRDHSVDAVFKSDFLLSEALKAWR